MGWLYIETKGGSRKPKRKRDIAVVAAAGAFIWILLSKEKKLLKTYEIALKHYGLYEMVLHILSILETIKWVLHILSICEHN